MLCSCCDFERAADGQFTAEKAAKELESYRKGRLGPTTRLLRDGVVQAGLHQGSLLDIGGGVGALTFELVERGITSAIIADASVAYAATARDEAHRRGQAGRVQIVRGDVLHSALPSAHLVTLDRVVCCYPSYESLLHEALRHATGGFALSYPRDRWHVRAAVWFENVRRARKNGFRTFVHPPVRMQEIIQNAGFDLTSRRVTLAWTIDVYVRSPASSLDGSD